MANGSASSKYSLTLHALTDLLSGMSFSRVAPDPFGGGGGAQGGSSNVDAFGGGGDGGGMSSNSSMTGSAFGGAEREAARGQNTSAFAASGPSSAFGGGTSGAFSSMSAVGETPMAGGRLDRSDLSEQQPPRGTRSSSAFGAASEPGQNGFGTQGQRPGVFGSPPQQLRPLPMSPSLPDAFVGGGLGAPQQRSFQLDDAADILSADAAMAFFMSSPAYDPSCSNEACRARGLTPVSAYISDMTGKEYRLVRSQPPALYVVHEVFRAGPDTTDMRAVFYITGNPYRVYVQYSPSGAVYVASADSFGGTQAARTFDFSSGDPVYSNDEWQRLMVDPPSFRNSSKRLDPFAASSSLGALTASGIELGSAEELQEQEAARNVRTSLPPQGTGGGGGGFQLGSTVYGTGAPELKKSSLRTFDINYSDYSDSENGDTKSVVSVSSMRSTDTTTSDEVAEYLSSVREGMASHEVQLIERQAVRRAARANWTEGLWFCLLVLMYVGLSTAGRDVQAENTITFSIRDALTLEEFPRGSNPILKTFLHVMTEKEYWEWLHGVLVPVLFVPEYAEGQPKNYIQHTNRIIGTVRFRQVRVKPVRCISSRFVPLDDPHTHEHCYPRSAESFLFGFPLVEQEKRDLILSDGTQFKWEASNASDASSVVNKDARETMPPGGYSQLLPVTWSYGNVSSKLKTLQNTGFIGLATHSVIVEFYTWNANLQLFTKFSIVNVFTTGGTASGRMEASVFPVSPGSGTAMMIAYFTDVFCVVAALVLGKAWLSEAITWYKENAVTAADRLKAEFRSLDVDSSGSLEPSEMKLLLASWLSKEPNDFDLESFMAFADTNGDGVISFEEFAVACSTRRQQQDQNALDSSFYAKVSGLDTREGRYRISVDSVESVMEELGVSQAPWRVFGPEIWALEDLIRSMAPITDNEWIYKDDFDEVMQQVLENRHNRIRSIFVHVLTFWTSWELIIFVCFALQSFHRLTARWAQYNLDLDLQDSSFPQLNSIRYAVEYGNYIAGLNLFLTIFRLVKFTQNNNRLNVMNRTISRASPELTAFTAIVALIMVAFVLFGNLAFGPALYEFATFESTTMTLFSILLGQYDISKVRNVNWFLGPIFVFAYYGIVVLLMFNLIVAIFTKAFKDERRFTTLNNLQGEPLSLQMSKLISDVFLSCRTCCIRKASYAQLDVLAMDTLGMMRQKANIMASEVEAEVEATLAAKRDLRRPSKYGHVTAVQQAGVVAELESVFKSCKAVVAMSAPEGWADFMVNGRVPRDFKTDLRDKKKAEEAEVTTKVTPSRISRRQSVFSSQTGHGRNSFRVGPG